MTKGIYVISGPNGRHYVGQSTRIEARLLDHFQSLRRGVHPNIHLSRAFEAYGEAAFSSEILEIVEDIDSLTEREQFWIDKLDAFKSGYNRAAIAGKPPSMKGIPKTQEHKDSISAANKGKQFSAEHKAAISLAKKGKPNPKHIEETKRKIGEALKGRPHSAERIENIRASKQNLSAETRARMSKPKSEEGRANMLAARRLRAERERAAKLAARIENS